MPYLDYYTGGPYFPRGPGFYQEFWWFRKLAFLFLFLLVIIIILAWNLQPWFVIQISNSGGFIVPKKSTEQQILSIETESTQQQNFVRATSIAYLNYVVRHGDTLSGIAAKFGVTLSALLASNRISDSDHIEAGQALRIPRN